MIIGLALGSGGDAVARLHRLLASLGHAVAATERGQHLFGETTAAALTALQRAHGLPPSSEIDAATLLLLARLDLLRLIRSREGTAQPTGHVEGSFVDGDGNRIARAPVTLIAQRLRGETALAHTETDGTGRYLLSYARPHAFNLAVQGIDATGMTVVTSATAFAAPAEATINLTTAADGIMRSASRFASLSAALGAVLDGTPIGDLTQNEESREVAFAAKAAGAPFGAVAHLAISTRLAATSGLLPETLFALLASGVPPDLDAALSNLPEHGIDQSFVSMVLRGVIAQGRAGLERVLTAAVAANIVPASYAARQAGELDILDRLRRDAVAADRYIRGKTPLHELLAAGKVAPAARTAFIAAYAAHGGRLGPTWKTLRADTGLSTDDLAVLKRTLSAGELLAGNLPLVKDVTARLAAKSLARTGDLALLDQDKWADRIREVDPRAGGIPPVLPGETVDDRIERAAKSLVQRFAGRFPTTAIAGSLERATASSFKDGPEVARFLTANPRLSLRRGDIDQFLVKSGAQISAGALADLKTMRRLFRISPRYAAIEALHGAGYSSAKSAYVAGRAPFLARMGPALGGDSQAKVAFARAQMIYATSLATYARFNSAFDKATPDALQTPSLPGKVATLPDFQALFGTSDYFACDDCQAIDSPAAYLVDLLQYLLAIRAMPDANSAGPIAALTNARDALLLRRPDIRYVALDCANTRIVIQEIDLANEILEAAIAPDAVVRPTLVETADDTATRRALPQQTQPAVADAAYSATAAAVFPLTLPFDVSFARATAYVAALGTSRSALLKLLPGTAAADVAAARLALNPALRTVIITANTTDPWIRWGLDENPAEVIDPKTKQAYSPTPADWVVALNKVPVLMTRAGLSLEELYQLLEVQWVTKGAVTLSAGTTVSAGQNVLSADQDAMTFTGLDGLVLDRANRFLRLRTASGRAMWELDWALDQAVGGLLDDDFLVFLADAQAVTGLTGKPFTQLLCLWGTIGTRDVTSHLADQDAVTPSAYRQIFGNPTVLASYSSLFADPAALSADKIVFEPSANPNAAQLQPLAGIAAALALDAADIAAILADSGAANTLTLPTLTILARYALIASALAMSVPDLILWIALTDRSPFGGQPSDTLEFLRRLAVLREGTGLKPRDLDYLLRGRSATQSAVALTEVQLLTVLQGLRDSLAKAVAAGQISVVAVTNATPIAITTDKPHGLATGAKVLVTGVAGNTAANGVFSISVTTPTGFTLTGSAGSGTWTGSGAVTPNLDTAVEAVAVAALAAGTGTSADVVTPALAATGVLPLDTATIQRLLSQATVDPAQFQSLVTAVTRVSKAAALFKAIGPASAVFAFAIEQAQLFGWLDPSDLPLEPVANSPFVAFETLRQAWRLQTRQPALTPKLFDVLGAWALPAGLPGDMATAIGGPSLTVTDATNATPIVVTTAAAHNLQTGARVAIGGVKGNGAANGLFTVTVTAPTAFSLDGTTGSGAMTTGGVVTLPDTPTLAGALDATATDVGTLAAAFGATAPSLAAATRTGSLADIAMLTKIAAALDVARRFGTGTATLLQIAAAAPDASSANAAMAIFQAQYAPATMLAAVRPVEDGLREARRDALVAYLLGPGARATPVPGFLTSDDIYDYFLIDPEKDACAETTRLLQPSLAIQQFVFQCFKGLTFGITVDTTDPSWPEWENWRREYRYWQAARDVFLYPENYLRPELRADASPFFADLASDLRQGNGDADAVDAALATYLRKLVEVSRLVVAAHYLETRPDGTTVLHVFARTSGSPPQWYYRTRIGSTPGTGAWNGWQPVRLDIPAGQLVPVIWDQRLHLIWPTFKRRTAHPSNQDVPQPTDHAQVTAEYWCVEFTMSDFSAGQWQPKRTYAEKMFFIKTVPEDGTDWPQAAFTFRARQDAKFNLQILVYRGEQGSDLIALATLSFPDTALVIIQDPSTLPDASGVDTVQEPSFFLVKTSDSLIGWLISPNGLNFSGQDLIGGIYSNPVVESVPMGVLCRTTAGAQPVDEPLLGQITAPRMIVPQQETLFDGQEVFFVADVDRTWLVQPFFYTSSSAPTELDDLTYVRQWTTRFAFETFYDPYARTCLREFEIGGAKRLMARSFQTDPKQVRGGAPLDFATSYQPALAVATPYPGTAGAPDVAESALDFATGSTGATSLYRWETFYHAPMFVADQLMQNQQFDAATAWLTYIFDPSDQSGGTAPQRWWQTAPFNALTAPAWASQQIDALLATLAAGTADATTRNSIQAWLADPFDPDAIAANRITAYAKATVMKYLDVLIAAGDALYAQYTSETVGRAEQLYMIARLILGPKPDQVRRPIQPKTQALTYATLGASGPLSDPLVAVENLVVAPEPPPWVINGTPPAGTNQGGSLPQLPTATSTLLFCIPPNLQMLAYWDKVELRISNIRHCLNLQGVAQPLPLYAPRLDIDSLIAGQAAGFGQLGGLAAAPIYRFRTYLLRAVELVNDVRSYGGLILSALEKKDGETLSVLRAGHELAIQTRLRDAKAIQVTEAQQQIDALQNQQAMVQVRRDFYASIKFMNESETAAITLQSAALGSNIAAAVLDLTASVTHAIPQFTVGVAGFGGTPLSTLSDGGHNAGAALSSAAVQLRTLAGVLGESGTLAATIGGYQRRRDEWALQAALATAELAQIASQIEAATSRLTIANTDLATQDLQIANAQAVSDFLTTKYTSGQLYDWMVSRLTTVHTQAYQLAVTVAQQAQAAYQYELGQPDAQFIQFSYWDGQHQGLTAGESLLFDLRRMDAQYLVNNVLENETIRNISLALDDPTALVTLLQTGSCVIMLDESQFDLDKPWEYFRRLRSVAVTIAAVAGPYTSVNATLALNGAVVRTVAPGTGYTPWLWPQGGSTNPAANDPAISASPPSAALPFIATSHAQNDPGLFELNLHDERWLPFEGQGAVSSWTLTLDPRDNRFDLSTVTDVVLHLRYSTRTGGNPEAVREWLKQNKSGRTILVSARSLFGDAWYAFFNPGQSAATEQALVLPLAANVFPYSNLGMPQITSVAVIASLATPMGSPLAAALSGLAIAATLGPTGGASTPVKLVPVPRTAAGGGAIAALSTGPVAVTGPPASLTLTLPQTSLPPALTIQVENQARLDPGQIADIVLLITYDLV